MVARKDTNMTKKPNRDGALTLSIGRHKYAVAGIDEASNLYQRLRDQSGLGASRWPQGRLSNGLTISLNGRVWRGEELVSEPVPYEARARS
jgi:hypothetical protein